MRVLIANGLFLLTSRYLKDGQQGPVLRASFLERADCMSFLFFFLFKASKGKCEVFVNPRPTSTHPFRHSLLLAAKGKRQAAMPTLVSDLNSNQCICVFHVLKRTWKWKTTFCSLRLPTKKVSYKPERAIIYILECQKILLRKLLTSRSLQFVVVNLFVSHARSLSTGIFSS